MWVRGVGCPQGCGGKVARGARKTISIVNAKLKTVLFFFISPAVLTARTGLSTLSLSPPPVVRRNTLTAGNNKYSYYYYTEPHCRKSARRYNKIIIKKKYKKTAAEIISNWISRVSAAVPLGAYRPSGGRLLAWRGGGGKVNLTCVMPGEGRGEGASPVSDKTAPGGS